MFQSYQYLTNLGYDQKTNQYRWKYTIIDSDFEEVADAVRGAAALADGSGGRGYYSAVPVGIAVIDTYEKRHLSVPINLALAFKYLYDQYEYEIEDIIYYNRKYNPKYKQYAEETEKQLQCLMDMKAFW